MLFGHKINLSISTSYFHFTPKQKTPRKIKHFQARTKKTYHLHPLGEGLLIALSINSGICCVFCAKTFTEVAVLFMARMAAISSLKLPETGEAWVKLKMDDVWWMLWREMFGEVFCRFLLKETSRCVFVLEFGWRGLHRSPKLQLTEFICIHLKKHKNSWEFYDESKHSF